MDQDKDKYLDEDKDEDHPRTWRRRKSTTSTRVMTRKMRRMKTSTLTRRDNQQEDYPRMLKISPPRLVRFGFDFIPFAAPIHASFHML